VLRGAEFRLLPHPQTSPRNGLVVYVGNLSDVVVGAQFAWWVGRFCCTLSRKSPSVVIELETGHAGSVVIVMHSLQRAGGHVTYLFDGISFGVFAAEESSWSRTENRRAHK